MTKILLFKNGRGLFPLDGDEHGDNKARMDRIGQGEVVGLDYRRSRNWENHKRFFHFRNVTFDMQDWYTDKERWRSYLMMLGGHIDEWYDLNGKYYFRVKSVAWEELDESAFQEVFAACVHGFMDWYEQQYRHRWTDATVAQLMDFL